MVQQSTGRRYQQTNALHESFRLASSVRAADDEAVRVRRARAAHELAQHVVDLEAQLARRRDDEAAEAAVLLEARFC